MRGVALLRRLKQWEQSFVPYRAFIPELLRSTKHPSGVDATGEFFFLVLQLMTLDYLFVVVRFGSDNFLEAMATVLTFAKSHPISKKNKKFRKALHRHEITLRDLRKRKATSFSFVDIWYEMLVCKAVDAFEFYLSAVLRKCLKKRPEAISDSSISVQDLLTRKDIDDAVSQIVDERVYKESFSGLSGIADFLQKRFGLTIDREGNRYQTTLEVIETRHMIVHNDSKVSKRFIEKTKSHGLKKGDQYRVDASYVLRALKSVRDFAGELDDTLKQKGLA